MEKENWRMWIFLFLVLAIFYVPMSNVEIFGKREVERKKICTPVIHIKHYEETLLGVPYDFSSWYARLADGREVKLYIEFEDMGRVWFEFDSKTYEDHTKNLNAEYCRVIATYY